MMGTCTRSLFIMADDLTGAADCAMGAAREGLCSIVLLDPTVAAEAQVIAIDADTRYCAPELAREICARLWRSRAAPEQLFFKKIDSTLRGNFAAEIAALIEAGVAIVAPAFPSVGRTMLDGRVFVHGVPLEATDIWSKEHMQGTADVVAMLKTEGVRAVNLPLDVVRGDLGAALRQLIEQDTVQAIVCDALTDADLKAIAGASVGMPVYWVGSAGLVAHLPGAAGLSGNDAAMAPIVLGSVVTVVGSLAAASREQARNLETGADVALFEPTPALLRAGPASALWQPTVDAIGQALAAGRDILIRTGTFGDDDLSQGHTLCQALGQLLLPLAHQIGALVVTGGETARALLPAFGTHSLQLLHEVEPGVPLSVSVGTRSLPVVTKAGAFGSPDALLKAYRMLARLRASNHLTN